MVKSSDIAFVCVVCPMELERLVSYVYRGNNWLNLNLQQIDVVGFHPFHSLIDRILDNLSCWIHLFVEYTPLCCTDNALR